MVLSIILLNYRQCGLVRQCLHGIARAALPFSYEVIVVDNDSRDGCASLIRSQFPTITVLSAPANLGFSAGNNLGIRHARGEYLLVLNYDVAVVTGAIPRLVEFLRTHPRVGVVGPRLVYPDGRIQYSCRRFPRVFTPFYRRTPLGRLPLARQELSRYLMLDFDHRTDQPVDWLFGACLLLRRAALDSVGYFDDRFFLYFEDLDWCRRCLDAGWQVWYVASVELVHYHAQSSAEGPALTALLNPSARHHLTSWLRYLAKYWGRPLPVTGRLDRRPQGE